MFVDASAIAAIMTLESEADALANVVEEAGAPIISAVAVFEATPGIRRKRHASVAEAQADGEEFLGTAGVLKVAITATETDTALQAVSRHGKGQGHPAQLILGDCFAYAVAKNHRVAMLLKGDDSRRSDIRAAQPA